MGFTGENTLFAESTCPDEINHDDPDCDIGMLLAKRWGEVFPMSGLGGLPFCGKTGWGAFSSHVPTDGNIVIMFAPHVGISKDGSIGFIQRDGHNCVSSACGAAIGAYNFNKENPVTEEKKEVDDYLDCQMNTIKMLLKPYMSNIIDSPEEHVGIVFAMYDIIDKFLNDIINDNW